MDDFEGRAEAPRAAGSHVDFFEVRPDLGASTPEPDLRVIIDAYYGRFYETAEAASLTARYVAAVRSEASRGSEPVDVCPDLGASTREPSLRTVILAYYVRHFDGARAEDLSRRYAAALRSLVPGGIGKDDDLPPLPETVDLPAATERGLGGQVTDAAWSALGGDCRDAAFWDTFDYAVRFTLTALGDAVAERAELTERLRNEVKEWREIADDQEATLRSWFNVGKAAETQVGPVISDSLKSYLRVSCSGGMDRKEADRIQAAVDDWIRLYAGFALAPAVRTVASSVHGIAEVGRLLERIVLRTGGTLEHGLSSEQVHERVRYLEQDVADMARTALAKLGGHHVNQGNRTDHLARTLTDLRRELERRKAGHAPGIVFDVDQIEALVALADWRDMASVPKDGRDVLLWLGKRPTVARWFDPWGCWINAEHEDPLPEDDRHGIGADVPTHWREVDGPSEGDAGR